MEREREKVLHSIKWVEKATLDLIGLQFLSSVHLITERDSHLRTDAFCLFDILIHFLFFSHSEDP